MKRTVAILSALLLAACDPTPKPTTEQKPQQLGGPVDPSAPAQQQQAQRQNSSSDWLLWGLIGYMFGSSNSTHTTREVVREVPAKPVQAPVSSAAAPAKAKPPESSYRIVPRQSDSSSTSTSPSPSRSSGTSSYSSTPSRSSSSSYSSGSTSRSSGSSSYSSGSRSSGSSYSSGGRR